MKNKHNTLLIASAVAILALYGCGSARKVVYQEPTLEDITVNSHIENGDYVSLINDAQLYPDKRERIIEFLSNKVDDCQIQYQQLVDGAVYAQNDSTLSVLISDATEIFEENVLNFLKGQSIEDIVKYYKEHIAENIFIRPLITSAIIQEINEDTDYYILRYYYELLQNTDIVKIIEPLYADRRTAIWDIQDTTLKDYFNTELEVFSSTYSNAYSDMCNIVEDAIPSILEESIQKIEAGVYDMLLFKINLSGSSLAERVQSVVDSVLTISGFEAIARSTINDIFATMDSNRKNLAEQIIIRDNIVLPKDRGLYCTSTFHPFIVPSKCLNAIDELKDKVRQKQNIVSLTTTVLGFIPVVGWAADLALSGADILFSIFTSQKEAKEVSNLLETFANELYLSLMQQLSAQSTDIYNEYKQVIIDSQLLYKSAIYEQF